MDIDCKRCGHTWVTRTDNKPKTCPNCKSPYYEKELTEYWRRVRENNKAAEIKTKE